MITSYPVVHFPARAASLQLLQHASGRRLEGAAFVAAEALCSFGGTLAIALWCTNLGAVFQLIGGTCGAALVLAAPGALLIQYALSKHRESRRQRQQQRPSPGCCGGSLHAPLLGSEAVGAAELGRLPDVGSGSPPAAYHLWASKLFWVGMLLQLLAAALCGLTVATVLRASA